jgi:hypothetical protein
VATEDGRPETSASSCVVITPRRWRAGESIYDYCRACKTDRSHTVIVVDGNGDPLRVQCGYCESQHNYRGGPRIDPVTSPVPVLSPRRAPQAANG